MIDYVVRSVWPEDMIYKRYTAPETGLYRCNVLPYIYKLIGSMTYTFDSNNEPIGYLERYRIEELK